MDISSRQADAPPEAVAPSLLTLTEVARRLGLSLRKVQQEVAMGRLVVARPGRSVRVHPLDLRAYLDACRGLAPGEAPPEARVMPLPPDDPVSVAPASPARKTVKRRGQPDATGTGSPAQ